MTEMTRGMEVHVIGFTGEIDRSRRFKIRSIGKKQAILDRIIDENNLYLGRLRGRAYYITNRLEAELRYGIENIPNYVKLCWLQHFVPAGDGDWDLDENY